MHFATDRPWVLDNGEHMGFRWILYGNLCGYHWGSVRVPPKHPWHGMQMSELADLAYPPKVLDRLNSAAPGNPPDDGWWIGFSCRDRYQSIFAETDCRLLCEQAAACALTNRLMQPNHHHIG